MKPHLKTLLAPLALAFALPALSAPVVSYEVRIPMSAIEAALGAGVFDGVRPNNPVPAEVLRLEIRADLGPVPAGFGLEAAFNAGDGFNLFSPPSARPTPAFRVVLREGEGAFGANEPNSLGDLADNESTDSFSVLGVEDVFNGVLPGNRPSLLAISNFVFRVDNIQGGFDDFEINFLQATDEVLGALPIFGASSFFRLEALSRGLTFTTSDFEMRLVDFVPDGGPGPGNNVPEPGSLALVAAALALMTRARRAVVA
jgi:PEP-CTERM motif